MLNKCYNCFRPFETCYCKDITKIETGIKFVFLMHPKEAYKQRTGTGRLAFLTLNNSEIIIDVDFTNNKRLNTLLSDKNFFPVVMYPTEDAWTANEYRQTEPHTLKEAVGNKTLLVILVDATWACAKKMLRLSENLEPLQKISFSKGYKSEFTFKKEPEEHYISTIETCYYLLKELQESEFNSNLTNQEFTPEPLMNIFRKMIQTQLESQKRREESGEPDRYVLSGTIRAKKREKRLSKDLQ